MLLACTVINDWRVSILVDEAHNMVERARKKYSAELSYVKFNLLQISAPKAFKGVIDKLSSSCVSLIQEQE